MRIALYRGTSLVSKLIEWQTRGEYSHAAVMLPDGSVIESKEFQPGGRGVRHVPSLLRDAGVVVDFYDVETTPAQDAIIIAFLKAQIGKPYDYVMVARFITREGLDPHCREKWFCSELVFAAFAAAGIQLLARTEAWEVHPSLLGRSTLLKKAVPLKLTEVA